MRRYLRKCKTPLKIDLLLCGLPNMRLKFLQKLAQCWRRAKKIYSVFYERLFALVDLEKFKIENWDAGWYQIRMILKDKNFVHDATVLKELFNKLGEKLLPQIYSLGFLRDEVEYFCKD